MRRPFRRLALTGAWLASIGLAAVVQAGLTLTAPVEYQVIQRTTRADGPLEVRGTVSEETRAGLKLAYRLLGPGRETTWRPLPADFKDDAFAASVTAPAGGWWRLEVQAVRPEAGLELVVAAAAVDHVGVGEVFVIAGQSNSANYGEERQKCESGRVSTFDGSRWRLADDPQPGAGGEGGSFLPPFGDALARRLDVPIGVVACGIGATSVREWLPRGSRFANPPTIESNVRPSPAGGWESIGTIFDSWVARQRSLGPRGYRAVLWHQGESDANQRDASRTYPGARYRESLELLIRESRRAVGWEAPWFVAQVSYHEPGDEASPDIREAQASLWRDGIALEGPDSDALKGDFRDGGGKGVHFSGPGLRAHAAKWVEKVAPWVESQATAGAAWTDRWIGYAELRTNLPGGRHANTRTTRAIMARADGTGRREVAPALVTDADTSTQFAGWSPDGRLAIVHQAWKSEETARWEEANRQFRFTADGCRLDGWLIDPETGQGENVTGVDRVSFYNGGVFFWPRDPGKLGFTALIEGASHPFRMDRDGRHKTDLTGESAAFSYGFSGSPDGTRVAFHQDYQIVLADADGSNARRIETGHPFNFGPAWSPNGEWILFVSGEHMNCHPHLVRADGTGLRQLADRGGYRGVVEFLDVPDFHGGSSDIPVWSADGASVFYTAQTGDRVTLHQVGLDGTSRCLVDAGPGTEVYHPQPSRDGAWLVYGARRSGVRQVVVLRLSDRTERSVTALTPGHAAMWPHWRPDPDDRSR